MKSYELYLFDLDNTLYNEFDFLNQAYKNISTYIEKKTNISFDIIYHFILNQFKTNGRKKLFDYLIMEFKLEKPVRLEMLIKIQHETAQTIKLTLFDWVDSVFKKIFSEQKIICILTNGNVKQQKMKVEALQLYSLYPDLQIYYANTNEENYPKPSPYWIHEILKRNNVNKINAVLIGDSITDKQCALSAEIQFYFLDDFLSTT